MSFESRRPSPSVPQFHGSWSLWDMLELKSGAFLSAASELTGVASFISGTSLSDKTTTQIFHGDSILDDTDRIWLVPRFKNLLEHLKALGADVTLVCVSEAEKQVANSWTKWSNVKTYLDEITNTLRRELSLKVVLVLEPQEANYFAPRLPIFGQNFADKFKTDGAFELDEAAKCLTLSRPTATVFHLMRILEIGMSALSACLSITDPIKPAERNWAVILRRIKEDGIDKKWPTVANRMVGDGLLFEALHASLDAVKHPWRNETMHVSGKYTDDEAKHIFFAVEGFMKKLSARMDERGDPKA